MKTPLHNAAAPSQPAPEPPPTEPRCSTCGKTKAEADAEYSVCSNGFHAPPTERIEMLAKMWYAAKPSDREMRWKIFTDALASQLARIRQAEQERDAADRLREETNLAWGRDVKRLIASHDAELTAANERIKEVEQERKADAEVFKKMLAGYEKERERYEAFNSELDAANERIRETIEVAHRHGWDGVNNSKLLAQFLDDALTDAYERIKEAEEAAKDWRQSYIEQCEVTKRKNVELEGAKERIKQREGQLQLAQDLNANYVTQINEYAEPRRVTNEAKCPECGKIKTLNEGALTTKRLYFPDHSDTSGDLCAMSGLLANSQEIAAAQDNRLNAALVALGFDMNNPDNQKMADAILKQGLDRVCPRCKGKGYVVSAVYRDGDCVEMCPVCHAKEPPL